MSSVNVHILIIKEKYILLDEKVFEKKSFVIVTSRLVVRHSFEGLC
jgi:hypothetical protein